MGTATFLVRTMSDTVSTVSDIVLTKNVAVPMGCLQASRYYSKPPGPAMELQRMLPFANRTQFASFVFTACQTKDPKALLKIIANKLLSPRFFERQPVFALGIALFAARHEIAFGGFATANDRHQVIHRQTRRGEIA